VAEVQGTFEERFAPVRDALAANFDQGLDVGASVAVAVEGEVVVDLWGGYQDEAKTIPWERDTITNVWSSTKTMAALCALILADRGELDVHAPVARYWPEFAVNGKDGVLVRHVMGHTAGLSGFQEPMSGEDLCDVELCVARLQEQAPWWEPGTQSGYHAVTQGYLIGEIVRRVTGESLGTFFAKEVAGPLGADFHIGLPPEADARVAKVIPPSPISVEGIDPTSVVARTFSNPPMAAEYSWTEAWRRAEIPAANGHGNARSVATIQAAVSNGGEAGGVRLLSERGLAVIFEEQARGVDLVLGIPLRLGVGFGLNGEERPVGPSERTCYWGGWGGSIVINDLDQRATITYMMNKMGEGTDGDLRGAGNALAAYAALAEG
jgi:CubicO group peptidase (beta-lactamase class C family)